MVLFVSKFLLFSDGVWRCRWIFKRSSRSKGKKRRGYVLTERREIFGVAFMERLPDLYEAVFVPSQYVLMTATYAYDMTHCGI